LTDCAAACLATILRVYRRRISIARIRHYAGTDRNGTNILGIVEAARRLGFEAKGVRGDLEALREVPLPCVAHVFRNNFLHFVVVHGITGQQIVLADPARGILRLPLQEFAGIWTGVLVLLVPGPETGSCLDSESVWSRFLNLIRPQRSTILAAFVAALVFALLGMTPSLYLQLLVDRVVPEKNWGLLRWLSVWVAIFCIFRIAFGVARGTLLARTARRIDFHLMLTYYRHVLHLPMAFFDARQTGEIISRFNDAVRIRDVVSGSSVTLLVDVATVAGGFVLLFMYRWDLALASLLVWLLAASGSWLMNPPLHRAQLSTAESVADLQSHLVESLGGLSTLKAFGAETFALRRTTDRLEQLLERVFRAILLGMSAGAAADALLSVGAVVVLWGAAGIVMRGQMTPGQMVAFYSILAYMLTPLLRLATAGQTLQNAVVAAERLGEIMDLPSDAPESGDSPLPLSRSAGRIEFRGVSFRYGTRELVLRNVTLAIEPRSWTALLGENGSGKSSLAKLLLRFYDPTGGCIQLDGRDLRSLSGRDWRARIGYVGQDFAFFSGTVEENLAVGGRVPSSDSLRRAIRDAGLEQTVATWPNGMKTYLGEGGLLLSGGQRQRLALARALARDPEILLLDEATSSLDPGAEREVYALLSRLKSHKTIIVIGHRLSATWNADHVVLLGEGRVLEQGHPRDLVAQQGLYFEMCRRETQREFSPAEWPAATACRPH
jgi:ATP-binding cassette subfamily B protein